MSAKWRRSLAWDDAFFPAWAAPAKFLLRTLSSIRLAVVLLLAVVVWGLLASVPLGLLARIPTYGIVGLSGLLSAAVPAVLALVIIKTRKGKKPPVVLLIPVLAFAAGAVAWGVFALPHMQYRHVTGDGFMLFKGFVQDMHRVRLRQMPYVEMGELEFYNAWPLRAVLLLFVANMIIATVRRIEFKFVNIGVLTVHTGIVILTLGSLLYGSAKIEGDILLRSGGVNPANGESIPGPWVGTYYDRSRVTLRARTEDQAFWTRFALDDLPRFNAYDLGSRGYETAWASFDPDRIFPSSNELGDRGRKLSIPVTDLLPMPEGVRGGLPEGVSIRVVGYTPYADPEPEPDWVRVDPETSAWRREGGLNPLKAFRLSYKDGARTLTMLPAWPRLRGETLLPSEASRAVLKFEVLEDPSPERLRNLMQVGITPQVRHALIIETFDEDGGPASRRWIPLAGDRLPPMSPELVDGFLVESAEVLDRPDLNIVTPGYENADTAMSKVRVRTPEGTFFTRWTYARFPEIAQDILDETLEDGRPKRVDPDPRIRLTHLDCLFPHVFPILEEGRLTRVVTRDIDKKVRSFDAAELAVADLLPRSHPGMRLELIDSWTHAEPYFRPVPVPLVDQDNQLVGTHARALVGVEVRYEAYEDWRRIVWLPLDRYPPIFERQSFGEQEVNPNQRTVFLPDGELLHLMFGRLDHGIPGFDIRLEDFSLIEYAHRGAPRDYASTVTIKPSDPRGEQPRLPGLEVNEFTHELSLNAPLRAPFDPGRDGVTVIEKVFGRLIAGLNPKQLKLSQAGWDPEGWEQTQQLADRGELPRPFARFTILHVGNNRGIHIIALGGILIALGTPWAFYVKPWLLRRKKRAIQRSLANGSSESAAGDAAVEVGS